MGRLRFDLALTEPSPAFIGPRLPPCQLEDHRWALTIEDGHPSLVCLDPCSEERKLGMNTGRHGPMCDVVYEFIDGMHMEGEIPVRPVIETEHTPSTPAGPEEWDAWLVVHPISPAIREAQPCRCVCHVGLDGDWRAHVCDCLDCPSGLASQERNTMPEQRYWGDPIPAHIPEDGTVQVDTMHEGVIVAVVTAGSRTMVLLDPVGARNLADSLLKATAQWEED